MRRNSYFSYFLYVLCLLLLLTLPASLAERFRYGVVRLISPSWQSVHTLKCDLSFFLKLPVHGQSSKDELNFELESLRLENITLKQQIDELKQQLFHQQQMQLELKILTELHQRQEQEDEPFWKEFLQRRKEHLLETLHLQAQAVKAYVVFRDPSSWSSNLWINVGEKDNEKLGKTIIAKNSPVVCGKSLVGVVESVGSSYSRVRLITDSGLVPSVRSIRGEKQNQMFISQIDAVITQLNVRHDILEDKPEKNWLLKTLYDLKETLKETWYDHFMAKGELHGTSQPIWRSRGKVLKGVGFNYDYADQEGPARNLRSGIPLDDQSPAYPLIKLGDLLVTTGNDGIFPADLHVAMVTKILPLKEGGCAYELEASAIVDMDQLKEVFVLPSLQLESSNHIQ